MPFGVTVLSVLLLSGGLLSGLVGCGPGPSVESGASSATANGADARSSIAVASPPQPGGNASASPTLSGRSLVVPETLAKKLASPDVSVRLQALDQWGKGVSAGSVDPLIMALEDVDERVQTRALELLVQEWQQAQETN